jgi:hypothetical protein
MTTRTSRGEMHAPRVGVGAQLGDLRKLLQHGHGGRGSKRVARGPAGDPCLPFRVRRAPVLCRARAHARTRGTATARPRERGFIRPPADHPTQVPNRTVSAGPAPAARPARSIRPLFTSMWHSWGAFARPPQFGWPVIFRLIPFGQTRIGCSTSCYTCYVKLVSFMAVVSQ